jgi:pyrroline-5-carboxylate reductase
MKQKTIAVLGAGTMGQAILNGLIGSGHPRHLLRATTRTSEAAAKVSDALGVRTTSDSVAASAEASIVVIALKPMTLPKVLEQLAAAGALKRGTLVVSISAGVSSAAIEAIIGAQIPVLRAMPNTPCAIGRGMTVLSRGQAAKATHITMATRIFEPLGRVLELEEKHMNTVTGLSASGPAFMYVIIEALADGAVARGLPRGIAIEMAAQMVYGAASMVLETGRHPAALKDDVTTPAGCTIAGILALEDGRIRSVLSRAVEVASVRAGELGRKDPGD